ncbi:MULTISPECIES: hypothetical protein [Chryseobacterium]|uniref:Lipoprotein n=1 Tax=Chryseobacterium taihuense TaxID=1141221 RepID=A0A4U8WAV9_9FLAO|nr:MULTISPECIES: hypothetical protein [Chryseobacterium]QQV03455.1 hypothetical protein I6I61_03665 [Chryseobacterium sp. FDAARGOS 1104]VFB03223.1 Uncharacterised protein [Chryseobacterium taihuense]
MKKLFLLCVTAILLVACQSKSDKVQQFVKIYNNSSKMMTSSVIKSTTASSKSPESIDIEVNTNTDSDDIETGLLTSALPELIGQAIKSEKIGKELLDSGVKFNLKVYGSNTKVILEEVIDNSKLNKNIDFKAIASGKKPNNVELNQMLDAFNRNLPIVDESTGTKIMSIKADENNNIVYTCEVTDSFASMIKVDGAEQMIKDEMLRSPQIQQIFQKTSVLGVNNIKYLYNDSKGNLIKEITITKQDLK